MSQLDAGGIGRRIARYRKLNRWSARQLADNTDGAISRDTIANIENGRRTDVTVRQFMTIALALRIPPAALLTDLQHPFEPGEIRFPGAAPAPLETSAPHIAVAAWLNAQTDNDTTNAARWVTRVTTLLADYLASQDAAEAHNAINRIATRRIEDENPGLAEGTAAARAELLALGVQLPENPSSGTLPRPV